jgi:hypothetical protein
MRFVDLAFLGEGEVEWAEDLMPLRHVVVLVPETSRIKSVISTAFPEQAGTEPIRHYALS